MEELLLSPHSPGEQELVTWRLKRINEKLYLVKEWYDPETKKKRTKSIGRVEWLEKLADEYKTKLEKRPYLKKGVAGPGGFEPPTTGLGVQSKGGNKKIIFRSQAGTSSATAWKIPLPEPNQFGEWLLGSRKIAESTAKDYLSYLERLRREYGETIPVSVFPQLKNNSWMHRLLRLVTRYAWEHGWINAEDRDRALSMLSLRGGRRRRLKAPIVELENATFTIRLLEAVAERLRIARLYHLMYLIMYYSGARGEEAEYLIRVAPELEPITHERGIEATGYIDLGEAVRAALHYNRGNKRCEYLWLPAWLLEAARQANKLLQELEEKEGRRIDLSRRLSYYINNLRKRNEDLKPKLLPPKMLRKLHMQVMEDLEISLEIRVVIQNRYDLIGDVVSLTNYSKILLRADQAYVEKILPALRGAEP